MGCLGTAPLTCQDKSGLRRARVERFVDVIRNGPDCRISKKNFEDPLTSRADRGLISAPWHACPVVGSPMTNLNPPMSPVPRLDSAAPGAPHGCPADSLHNPRTERLVRGFFERLCPILPRFPMFFYGGFRPRRSMRHHRHVSRWHQHTAARRCRAHRSGGPDPRERATGRRRSRICQEWVNSRIGQPPIREARGHEAAGQRTTRAVGRDPDCRGRLAVKLLRLLGGRQ